METFLGGHGGVQEVQADRAAQVGVDCLGTADDYNVRNCLFLTLGDTPALFLLLAIKD